MGRRIDLVGQVFGRLTVQELDATLSQDRKRSWWVCKCECGQETTVSATDLRKGHTKSCGCLHRDQARERGRKRAIDLTGQTEKTGKSLDYYKFFGNGGTLQEAAANFGVSYERVRRYWVEWSQQDAQDSKHHPEEKANQIRRVLDDQSGLDIYEAHGGHGFCTGIYRNYGQVTSKTYADGDDRSLMHTELGSERRYDVVDWDPYGFSHRALAGGLVELLRDRGCLFLTWPLAGSHFPSPISGAANVLLFGVRWPGVEEITRAVKVQSLLYHRVAELVDWVSMNQMLRLVFRIERVSATRLWTYNDLDVTPETIYPVQSGGEDNILAMFGDE